MQNAGGASYNWHYISIKHLLILSYYYAALLFITEGSASCLHLGVHQKDFMHRLCSQVVGPQLCLLHSLRFAQLRLPCGPATTAYSSLAAVEAEASSVNCSITLM